VPAALEVASPASVWRWVSNLSSPPWWSGVGKQGVDFARKLKLIYLMVES